MANIRQLNQRAPESFWEWVNQMNQNRPGNPGNPADDTARKAGEGSSRQTPPPQQEQPQPEEHGVTNETATEKGDADPPTPPEEFLGPEDYDYLHFDEEPHPPTAAAPPPAGASPWGPQAAAHHGHGGRGARGPHGPHAAHGTHGPGGPHGGFGGRRGRGGMRGRGWHGHGRGGFPMGGGPPFAAFGGGFPFGPHHGGRGGNAGADWGALPKMFMEHFGLGPHGAQRGGGRRTNNNAGDDGAADFEPAVDVYDTPAAFVVHVSLPGAKKEDTAVNWDSARSALTIEGVITRDVDEKMAEALALNERDVGIFSRVVRLGDAEHPASVDGNAISGKMEDGILKLTVPKNNAAFEVKKVQIQ